MLSASQWDVRSALELGSGGGNDASHLKRHFEMTLVDLSPAMLRVSQMLNPTCEHAQGDMRAIRLNRQFHAVLVHDAVGYMASEEDLHRAIETAYLHCSPGAVALFAPDHVCETLRPHTEHGGHNGTSRSLRYLHWTSDPDPRDTVYQALIVYVLRRGDEIDVVEDIHVCGLFGVRAWLRTVGEAGFDARALPFEHSGAEPGSTTVVLGARPEQPRI